MTRGHRLVAALATLAVAFVAGCGGASGGGGGGAGTPGAPGAAPGFDGSTIKLGVVSALSGPVAVIGKEITAGNKVWFDHLNAQGGVAGRYRVELVQEDHQYKTDLAVQRYNKIKGDVLAFTQLLGTPNTLAVLPLLKADGMVAAPASYDAFWVREPNLLPIGAPYQVQAINALDYYLTEDGGSPGSVVCSMIQDDVYGEAGQAGLDFAAQRRGVRIANTQRFKVNTTDYTGQIQALTRAGCEMVFLVAAPSDAGRIWGAAAQTQFPGRWIGQSPTWIDEFANSPLTPYLRDRVLIVGEGTEWGDTGVPGMRDMLERIQRYAPQHQPDYFFTAGYNQGRVMTALLEKAVERGDLSRAGVLAASRELGTVSFDGLSGDYRYGPAETREPPRTSTIFSVDPSKPFGLATRKYNFSSPDAQAYVFQKANL